MKKIVAVVFCWFLAFGLGFSLLPSSFNLIIGWLGPVFGTSLRLVLSTLFLLFADPLAYKSLIVAWAVVGFIGGLIVRKRIGSVLTMLPVYTGQFLVVGLSGFRIFETIQQSGILQQLSVEKLLTFLPPIPPGVSLNTVLDAPVIGDLASKLPSGITGIDPGMVIDLLLSTVVLNAVKNIAILCVAALVGCEVGKLIGRLIRPRRSPNQGPAEVSVGPQVTTLKKTLLLSLLVLLSLSSAVIPPVMGKGSGGPYYSETIVGAVTPDGTAYVASLFVDTVLPMSGISFTNPAFTGAIAAFLISQETTAATLPPLLSDPEMLSEILPQNLLGGIPPEVLGELTRYYDLLFPTMFVVVYFDVDATTAKQRANDAASAFSSAYGTSLIPMAFPIPLPEIEGHVFTPFVYYSSDTLTTMAKSMITSLPTGRGGLTKFVKAAYNSGVFIPGGKPKAANGTVMFAGFARPSSLWKLMAATPSEITSAIKLFFPEVETPLGAMGIGSYWLKRYHSSTFNFNFSINELLGIVEALEFSTFANVSTAAIVVPNSTVTDVGEVPLAPIVKIFTTAPMEEGVFAEIVKTLRTVVSAQVVSYTPEQVAAGITITPEAIKVAFTKLFPMDLLVEKSLSVSEMDAGGETEVTIKITNKDTAPARGVKLDDSLSLSFYPYSTKLVEGELTGEWQEIPGGSSVSHKYKVSLSREGIYTLPFALVSYNYTGARFFARSNPVYATVRGRSFFNVLAVGIPYAWNLAVKGLNMVPMVEGRGQTILTGIVVVVVGAVVFSEYWGYRKRKKKAE